MNTAAGKYCALSIPQLKIELRKRNAKLSGRKSELIDRLEAYDRNSNFGQVDPTEPGFNMITPDSKEYKDINSDTYIPLITEDSFQNYLSNMQKILDEGPKNLYKVKFLRFARISKKDNIYYIKSQCCAEMKQNVLYMGDISINPDGIILECQCECASGMGPEAHCKHICAILVGLQDFGRKKRIITSQTCTEQLQTFHHVGKYKGSSKKACDLKLKKEGVKGQMLYDPRLLQYRQNPNYNTHFSNIIISGHSFSKMPISDIIPPANLYAIANDHDYLKLHPEDEFLFLNKLCNISEKDVATIEMQTRGQVQNSLWHTERKKRINSSNFGEICKLTDRCNKKSLAQRLMQPTELRTAPILHGRKYETLARKKYSSISGNTVADCGTCVCKNHPFLASFPDGVNSKCCIEIKCPYSARNVMINPDTVRCIETVDGVLKLKEQHNYHYQVQGQLLCADKMECDFVIFTLVDLKIIKVCRDDIFIKDMIIKHECFYKQVFRSEWLDMFFYKDLGKYVLN